ncbi:MAG: hypothetical protein HOB12_00445 [Gemmatimonadales bacterium]|nr:hypothetical protein [Gemmatimonadales bacterium]
MLTEILKQQNGGQYPADNGNSFISAVGEWRQMGPTSFMISIVESGLPNDALGRASRLRLAPWTNVIMVERYSLILVLRLCG